MTLERLMPFYAFQLTPYRILISATVPHKSENFLSVAAACNTAVILQLVRLARLHLFRVLILEGGFLFLGFLSPMVLIEEELVKILIYIYACLNALEKDIYNYKFPKLKLKNK